MNRITPNAQDNGDKEIRGNIRKDLEKGLLSKSKDKVQINDLMLGALVLIAAIMSFTDFTLSFGSIRNFTALTLLLYVVTTLVYRNRYSRGKHLGHQDAEYITALGDYRGKLKGIYDRSVANLVPTFCKEYKVKELREYRENLLADIEMTYDEYKEKYWGMPFYKILALPLSLNIKKTLIKCNQAKAIKLYPSLILSESGEADREKLAGKSGKDRERIDKRKQMIERAIIVVFGSAIVINIILDFSLITIFQWFVRMCPIVMAWLTGEDSGFCCIAVTETNFKRDQTSIINLFDEWVPEYKARVAEEEKLKAIAEETAENNNTEEKE